MSAEQFRMAIYDPDFRSSIIAVCDHQALQRLEYRSAVPLPLTYQEFIDIVRIVIRSLRTAAHGVQYAKQTVTLLSESAYTVHTHLYFYRQLSFLL